MPNVLPGDSPPSKRSEVGAGSWIYIMGKQKSSVQARQYVGNRDMMKQLGIQDASSKYE